MPSFATFSSPLQYSWDQVVTCYWKKYPNKHSKHVLSEDVIERKLLDSDKLYTRRVLTKTSPLPKWGTSIFPADMKKMVYIIEESIVDRKNNKMTVFTWNVNLKSLMDYLQRDYIYNAVLVRPTSGTETRQTRPLRIPNIQKNVTEKMVFTPAEKGSSFCQKEGSVDSEATHGFGHILRKFGISKWHANAVKAHRGFEDTLHYYFPKASNMSLSQKATTVLKLPQISDQTMESIKTVKEKAKNAAKDLNVVAHHALKQQQSAAD